MFPRLCATGSGPACSAHIELMPLNQIPRDLRNLAKLAQSQGWTLQPTRKGHVRFNAPDGATTVLAGGTPSDHRSTKNLLSLLRRSGLEVPRSFKS